MGTFRIWLFFFLKFAHNTPNLGRGNIGLLGFGIDGYADISWQACEDCV